MAAEFIYGVHPVRQILDEDPLGILSIWVLLGSKRRVIFELRSVAEKNGITVMEASRRRLDDMVAGANHQGILCKYRSTRTKLDLSGILKSSSQILLLVLDGIQDPHNLGACLRTAGAVGANAVIAPRSRGVGLTSAVRKVASGAAEVVPLVMVPNLARSLSEMKNNGIQVVGCDAAESMTIYDVDFRGPSAIVLGGEGKGLRRLTRERCDFLVQIPSSKNVPSLNVSVAGGVCLYEALRQREIATHRFL